MAVLIAFIAISASGVIFSDNAKAIVQSWTKKIEFGGPLFEFREKAPADKLPEYEFGWLPGKYSLKEEVESIGKEFKFTNPDDPDDFMRFTYMYMDDDTVFGLSGEGFKYDICSVNGHYAEFYYRTDEEGDQNLLLWADEDEQIFYTLSSDMDKEVMLRIAEDIKEVEKSA